MANYAIYIKQDSCDKPHRLTYDLTYQSEESMAELQNFCKEVNKRFADVGTELGIITYG